MQAYRPDRVVRITTRLVSLAYYGAWAVAALFFIVGPALKKLAPDLLADPVPRVAVHVALPGVGASTVSQWDVGSREVELWEVGAILVRPTSQLPAWFGPATYLSFLTTFVFVLLFFYHLRALFQRVREGAPFDAANAARMRWLGVWLLAFHLSYGGFEFGMSWYLAADLASSGLPVAAVLDINWFAVFVALVLVGLAEVFRRGAALEEEQSLVV